MLPAKPEGSMTEARHWPKWELLGPFGAGNEYELLCDRGLVIHIGGPAGDDDGGAVADLVADANRGSASAWLAEELLFQLSSWKCDNETEEERHGRLAAVFTRDTGTDTPTNLAAWDEATKASFNAWLQSRVKRGYAALAEYAKAEGRQP